MVRELFTNFFDARHRNGNNTRFADRFFPGERMYHTQRLLKEFDQAISRDDALSAAYKSKTTKEENGYSFKINRELGGTKEQYSFFYHLLHP